MASRKYVEAEAELQSAWELNPTFDVAYNLGNTKYQLKKYREAAEHLSFALRNWPLVKTVAKLKPTAEQRLAESRAQVGALRVTVSAAGAEVLVDGKALGRAPLEGEVFVEPGEHRVEARLEGYAPVSQTVKSAKGETADVGLAMVAEKSEAQAAGVKTEGGMGAAGVGVGAPVMGQPPAGPVEPPPKKNWVPVIALGAASAVGLGVGIGMTVAGSNVLDDVHAQRQSIRNAGGQCTKPSASFVDDCAELSSAGERVDTLGHVAGAAYVASGVLAAAALTYALWPRGETRTAGQPRVVATAHPTGAGVVVLGAW
ncbi:PEGA domain-containing protein [Sorangium atrum]|uniref:PEGA domain-containing protein n=1 Tax=Sorangium atrum TaxID=2995308 RepID=A0ABT5C2T3_9BACT|nr:PEGA domain-containing protein [Sorangium aterium]MDC0680720.1 PEGA domain-containing protein [Sorangium aterium]